MSPMTLIRAAAACALAATAAVVGPSPARAQQVPDTAFRPPIARPAYAPGQGPIVRVDEGHHEFHTVEGRYAPFAALLRRDGYRVRGSRAPLTAAALQGVRVLVIANALAPRNVGEKNWALPTPSAFSPAEIAAVRAWVHGGGSLLLVVDHMPFPGAAAALARAFDVKLINGFAVDTTALSAPIVYHRTDASLVPGPITDGRSAAERVDSVATFTGSALFDMNPKARPLLLIPAGIVSLEPKRAWVFTPSTPKESVMCLYQAVATPWGRGRVVVTGEAAMFSAQLAGPHKQPMGMNAPVAGENVQFLLNTMHWLSGLLPVS